MEIMKKHNPWIARLIPRSSRAMTGLLLLFLGGTAQTTRLTNPIMPMTTCMQKPFIDNIPFLDDAGFDGLFYWNENDLDNVLDSLHARDMQMMGVYREADAADIPDVINSLEGTGTQLALVFPSNKYSTDEQVLADLTSAAGLAAQNNIDVVIYPHFGFYIEKLEKALEIVEAAGMDNIGIMYNLNHSIRVYDRENIHFSSTIYPILESAMPKIWAMTIVGSDTDGTAGLSGGRDFKKILGEGNFDTFGYVDTILEMGYTGVFTVQCFGIQGDKIENLTQTITVYDRWRGELLEEQVSILPQSTGPGAHYHPGRSLLSINPAGVQGLLVIRNIMGKTVKKFQLKPGGRTEIRLNLPAGIYRVTLPGVSGSKTHSIVVL